MLEADSYVLKDSCPRLLLSTIARRKLPASAPEVTYVTVALIESPGEIAMLVIRCCGWLAPVEYISHQA